MVESFLQQENKKLDQLLTAWNHAVWMVNTTGEKEWQVKEAQAEATYREYCADKDRFSMIQQLLKEVQPGSLEERQLQRLVQEAVENQLPKQLLGEMVQLSSKLSNIFNTFRGSVDGKKVTENEVRHTLIHSDDTIERKKVWEASKQIGNEVQPDLLRLVRLRNQAAKSLGYEDHHQMMFQLQELDRDEVFRIFQELKELTDEPFRKVKDTIDQELSTRFQIDIEELRPWHYMDPFFQEAPSIEGADLSPFIQQYSVEKCTAETFQSLGMEIKDLLARSDLYEREGKNQHAFCIDMDRQGDVRVLCNIHPNEYWMETMLHEFGHAVYDKYMDLNLPFILRTPSHIFTTEAIAMFFGRMVRNREWLHKFIGMSKESLDKMMPKLELMLQRQMLITARWVMTFVFFEKELYANPDQDLNRLWWKLVKEIQYVHPPETNDEPHWAAKIHFTIAPVYYQNYLLGELTASQFDHYIRHHVSDEMFTKKTGQFFMENVFFPGDRYNWQELINQATGEPLNPKYFVEQFVY
ncbi:peptidyl-dipeptidase A [Hazenella coriacea]|uniref:Peptidyl-dipeptidase A n=1 Tax=Hazenella coriacea TaxID=1179467 RepID=A0A4R3LBS2_9BACL|nr:peptidyl-dipeptidase A [Hazenella coriacea]